MSIAPLGILGGTFDPIHNGHLRLAQEAMEQCGLSAVHFIPSGVPPHRGTPRASAAARLEITRLALQGNPAFILNDCEIRRDAPCYTVDTLAALRAGLFGAEQPLCLLMGSDAFLQLHTWRDWRRLFSLAHIVAVQRASAHPLGEQMATADAALREEYRERLASSAQALSASPAGAVLAIHMPALEISATDIRRRCADGRSARYLLPDAVATHIHTHDLYAHAER